jgi:hypothetical protein
MGQISDFGRPGELLSLPGGMNMSAGAVERDDGEPIALPFPSGSSFQSCVSSPAPAAARTASALEAFIRFSAASWPNNVISEAPFRRPPLENIPRIA